MSKRQCKECEYVVDNTIYFKYECPSCGAKESGSNSFGELGFDQRELLFCAQQLRESKNLSSIIHDQNGKLRKEIQDLKAKLGEAESVIKTIRFRLRGYSMESHDLSDNIHNGLTVIANYFKDNKNG